MVYSLMTLKTFHSSSKRLRIESPSSASILNPTEVDIDLALALDPDSTITPPIPTHEKKRPKPSGWFGKGEEPFIFLSGSDHSLDTIKLFYGLDPSFPIEQCLVRSEGGKHRNVYFVSESVKRILMSQDASKLKIVNTGVKVWSRVDGRKENKTLDAGLDSVADAGVDSVTDADIDDAVDTGVAEDVTAKASTESEIPAPAPVSNSTQSSLVAISSPTTMNPSQVQCNFRLYADGLPIMLPFITSRLISIPKRDLLLALEHQYPHLTNFSPSIQEAFKPLELGCILFVYEPKPEDNVSFSTTIVLSLWLARFSVSLFLNKMERKSLYDRMTGKELVVSKGLDKHKKLAVGIVAGGDAGSAVETGEMVVGGGSEDDAKELGR